MCPTSEPMTLRPATRADASMIVWLEEVAMKDYATRLWGVWRPSGTAEELDVSTHEMILSKGAVVGCLATRIDTLALHLLRLYLAPDARNNGIGSAVLETVVRRAGACGRAVKLRVLVNNPAVRFYRRHGFRTESQTQHHICLIHDPARYSMEEPDENN